LARLDAHLVDIGLVENRSKARQLVLDNKVTINNNIVSKPSFKIEANKDYDIKIDDTKMYVSRAGNKLDMFLDSFELNLKDFVCLDIGSSTGGFSQVLLENDVKSISCVDVGSDQLHDKIRYHEKVKVFENCDIRDFKSETKFDLVTCDVSFISIRNILSSIDYFANEKIIILFKPQFEVGKNIKRDKKGVVKDQLAINKAIEDFELFVNNNFEWRLIKKEVSKLSGKDGNIEYFYYFGKKI
jgi:23S rRNA (cytidine1920-2'-O)/16S rRNA (cytidine1409-2'-O)-methyltransferase